MAGRSIYKERVVRFFKDKRLLWGLTQAQMGYLLNIGRTSVTNIEAGRQPITADTYLYMKELFYEADVVKKARQT